MNSVYSLEKSSNGLLWVGTPGGLQRFDGYGFDNWDQSADSTKKTGLSVYHIREDSRKNIWVFNTASAFVFPQGEKTYQEVPFITTIPSSDNKQYFVPLQESDNRLWCYSASGYITGFNTQTLKGDTAIRISDNYPLTKELFRTIAVCSAVDEEGTAWISGSDEQNNFITKFHPGTQPSTQIFPVNKYGVLKGFIPVSDKKFLFISTTQTFLCRSDSIDSPLKILSRDNVPGNHNRRFTFEKLSVFNKGSILFPGNEFIYEYNPSAQTLKPYSTTQYSSIPLSRQLVFAIREDNHGNIWIGRDAGDGLLVYYPSKLQFGLLEAPKEYFNLVYSMAIDANNNIYAANFEKGINVFSQNGKWLRYIPIPQKENNLPLSIRCMQFIDKDHLLMKSLYGRVLILNTSNNKITDLTSLIPERITLVKNAFYASFLKENENSYLFSHNKFLLRFIKDNNKYTIQVVDSVQEGSMVSTLAYTQNKELVLGTDKDCIFYSKEKSIHVSLPGNPIVKHMNLHPDGSLWVATVAGIHIIRDYKVVKSYTTSNGLLNDFIYGILFDEKGNAWYSSNKGLGCIQPNGQISFYSEEDGIQAEEFDTQSFCKGIDGTLYFGGVKAITSFTPSIILQKPPKSQIVISGIEVSGVSYPLGKRIEDINLLELNHNDNTVVFNFALTDFSDPATNIFLVKMDNLDKEWYNLKNLHSLRYSFPPGKYTLSVKGSSDGSNWSEPLLLPILIHPAWWQQWQFRLAMGILFVLLVLFLAWWWNRRKLKAQWQAMQVQQELQKERERISRDLHDNIGAYTSAMIAHVDSLKRKTSATAVDNSEMEQLKEDAQQILGSLRETIWVLKNENLSLTDFFDGYKQYAAKLLRNNNDISIEFNETIENNRILSPTIALHLYRILQECLQNTIKHADADKIEIVLTSTNKISLLYSDNGKGFETDPSNEGNGLDNMRFRANEAGFTLELKTGTGKGTQILLSEK